MYQAWGWNDSDVLILMACAFDWWPLICLDLSTNCQQCLTPTKSSLPTQEVWELRQLLSASLPGYCGRPGFSHNFPTSNHLRAFMKIYLSIFILTILHIFYSDSLVIWWKMHRYEFQWIPALSLLYCRAISWPLKPRDSQKSRVLDDLDEDMGVHDVLWHRQDTA